MPASDTDTSAAVDDRCAVVPPPARVATRARVIRARVRYSKTGKLRFVSAIDVGRLWERALRRADAPIAYSEGFSPHPKISFADALPLGYASVAEYAELTFAVAVDLAQLTDSLNSVFPDGMAVLAAVDVPDGAPKLGKLLQASVWDLGFPSGVAPLLPAAVRALDAADRLVVPRSRKGETTDVDVRPAIADVSVRGSTVRVVLHHADQLPVRPTEVELALRATTVISPVPDGAGSAADRGHDLLTASLVTRVAQGCAVRDGLEEAFSRVLVPPLSALATGSEPQ